MEQTFFEKWNEGQPGFTNLGGFHTLLMKAYREADSDNRRHLAMGFPGFFMLEKDIPVYADVAFDNQLREDLLVTALEGGSNYWYLLTDVSTINKYKGEGEPLSTAMWKAVLAGEKIPIFDIEDEAEQLGHFDLAGVRHAEELMFTKHKGHYIDATGNNWDATTADVWFQLAVLGEVTYG